MHTNSLKTSSIFLPKLAIPSAICLPFKSSDKIQDLNIKMETDICNCYLLDWWGVKTHIINITQIEWHFQSVHPVADRCNAWFCLNGAKDSNKRTIHLVNNPFCFPHNPKTVQFQSSAQPQKGRRHIIQPRVLQLIPTKTGSSCECTRVKGSFKGIITAILPVKKCRSPEA